MKFNSYFFAAHIGWLLALARAITESSRATSAATTATSALFLLSSLSHSIDLLSVSLRVFLGSAFDFNSQPSTHQNERNWEEKWIKSKSVWLWRCKIFYFASNVSFLDSLDIDTILSFEKTSHELRRSMQTNFNHDLHIFSYLLQFCDDSPPPQFRCANINHSAMRLEIYSSCTKNKTQTKTKKTYTSTEYADENSLSLEKKQHSIMRQHTTNGTGGESQASEKNKKKNWKTESESTTSCWH